ncbi:division/cell wall cluster transcriptional repressor MraZ [Leucothrix pacifica]|uniref:Transcriptional regulator MraZ n=1 Tax=Leucothrix pacifica TaxID=1247513 RepID=A0A317CEL3_9GAMM|nr:division/cell wall cluster transcriptional repressor MraZ [Leucothrix pacifica]PWQ95783.1 cell division/cell wall cluster transcriptional repressor MraZ [Leucothrix pacifica]
MFRGISNLNVDTKGRIAIPSRYRESIQQSASGQMVVTVDHTDHCLLVYAMDEWINVERTLMRLPNMNRSVRNMQRLVLGHASEVELDSQGRIRLSPPLREYAGIEKASVLVGQANKFELWDEGTWLAQRDSWIAEAQANLETDDVLSQVSL